MQDMFLCNMESDPYLEEMLAVKDGFWYIERFGRDSFHGVYVFDRIAHRLYIRTSSYVIRELPEALRLKTSSVSGIFTRGFASDCVSPQRHGMSSQ